MKKNTVFFLCLPVLAMVFVVAFPGTADAMSIGKRFRGNAYSGTYEVTYDPCRPSNIGNVGYLTISELKLGRKGKVKKGTKSYWNSDSLGVKGKLFKNINKKKKYRVKFRYPRKDGAFAGMITGYITQKKIKGRYDHFYEGCEWGGKVNLPRVYN
ncbi:hypothetical protein KKC88_06415 [Patescibacteria group bacterium]|nr:hypothetical protein [Patescibacteria group bacterium]MBU1673884.1 hypothetical protein [Patescibacteria group bacterium]MBU1963443.1 hypothetical protein [Patescibacteria group bacterium]